MSDPLERLDKSRGGIPATSEVKNRDKLLVWDPAKGKYPYTFLVAVWDWTLELIAGKIRTLTITRKDVEK